MKVLRTMPMRLGPYLLTECIGTGGMAAVYRGKRRGTAGFETAVVVKVLLPEHRRNHGYVRMFKEEARLSAQLQHNNVVRVHDFGLVAGIPFLEMEDLTGWNLQQVLDALAQRNRRVPLPIALTLASEACRGLAYAHSFVDDKGTRRPIIHRDVSPANVMICRDGSVKLVDFGLARLTSGETLQIETFHGKLAYMSPEQLDRRQLDRRADVFALGVTLHELLTGRRLFGGGNARETLHRLADDGGGAAVGGESRGAGGARRHRAARAAARSRSALRVGGGDAGRARLARREDGDARAAARLPRIDWRPRCSRRRAMAAARGWPAEPSARAARLPSIRRRSTRTT